MVGARTSRGRFDVRVFCLSNNGDLEDYKEIMQSTFDEDGRFELLEEEGYWTKEGDRMIVLKFLEHADPIEEKERY